MNPNAWLEKAERLRSSLARLRLTASHEETSADHLESVERVAIAHWLREEFSDEPSEDARTLPLFVLSSRE
jgi:hypothetical protein